MSPQDGADRDPHGLARLAELAMAAAVDAGHFIVAQRPLDLGVSSKSTATDVVTIMDARAESRLRELILQARPQDGFFGEEDTRVAGTSGLTWVVDPIDGTVNYLYGLPNYAVSVAVVTGDPAQPGHWAPQAGAVYQPVTGDLFHAHAGGGAWLRYVGHSVSADRAIRVADPQPLAACLIGTGFAYHATTRQEQARVLVELIASVRDIRRAGSAALDLCMVARGQLDAYYERGVHPWDVAAGWLLVAEAGGLVSGMPGEPVGAEGIVAGSPGAHRDLIAALAAFPGGPGPTRAAPIRHP